jgi:hypothetical protein
MNVREINPGTTATLPNYVATTVLLTAVTIWVVVAIQAKYQSNNPEEVTVWSRLTWPLTFARYLFGTWPFTFARYLFGRVHISSRIRHDDDARHRAKNG